MVGNGKDDWDGRGYGMNEECSGSKHWNRKAIMGVCGNPLWRNFNKSMKKIQIRTPSHGEYKVLPARFLSWKDFQ